MSERWERFWGGFLGTVLICLAVIGLLVLESYLIIHVGVITAGVILVVIVATFAGYMHASSEDKSRGK